MSKDPLAATLNPSGAALPSHLAAQALSHAHAQQQQQAAHGMHQQRAGDLFDTPMKAELSGFSNCSPRSPLSRPSEGF